MLEASEMDGIGSGWCPMAIFCISGIEFSTYTCVVIETWQYTTLLAYKRLLTTWFPNPGSNTVPEEYVDQKTHERRRRRKEKKENEKVLSDTELEPSFKTFYLQNW
jgi:hypothetical protein